MIQAYNVNMSYKEDIQVLNDVSFEPEGFVFLVGEVAQVKHYPTAIISRLIPEW